MHLYIVRHGISIDREDPDCPPEAERYLTPKGIEKTREAVRGLRRMDINPDLALTSPYVRAVQTAEIFCSVLGFPESRTKKTDALKPDAPPRLLFEELAKSKAQEVICFGHGPNVDELIAFATHAPKAFTELKKAGVACLDLHSVSPADGSLLWLMTARALRDLDD
jgi:phosphohistidine phosphatase